MAPFGILGGGVGPGRVVDVSAELREIHSPTTDPGAHIRTKNSEAGMQGKHEKLLELIYRFISIVDGPEIDRGPVHLRVLCSLCHQQFYGDTRLHGTVVIVEDS
jgi:hypothetical protein